MQPLVRRRHAAPAHDPAPSKLDYRYQRLMLTPAFRVLVRIGVPLMLVAIIIASVLSHADNRQTVANWLAQAQQRFQQSPQFMVTGLQISGADDLTGIEALLPDLFPVSSFNLDLPGIRTQLQALPTIKSAVLRIGAGGALHVTLTPRQPVALWRDGDQVHLIDADGVQSGLIDARADRPALPLIAGDGAEAQIDQALQLVAATGPLLGRLRGLERIGARRWDLVLDRGQRILLPADQPGTALDRVIALDAAQQILARDVTHIDMRNMHRPTVRVSAAAVAAMRRANSVTGSNEVGN